MGNEQSGNDRSDENEKEAASGGFWEGLDLMKDVSSLVGAGPAEGAPKDLESVMCVDEGVALSADRAVVLEPPEGHAIAGGPPAVTVGHVESFKAELAGALRAWDAPPRTVRDGETAFEVVTDRPILHGNGKLRVFTRDVRGRETGSALEVVALVDLPASAQRVFPCVWDPAEYVQHDFHFVDIRVVQRTGEGASAPGTTPECSADSEAAVPYRVARYLGKALPWPVGAVVQQRDIVIAQHASAFRTASGGVGYAMVMRNTSHPDCPGTENVVRASLLGSGGFVALPHPTDSARCLLAMAQAIDVGGGLPRELVDFFVKRTPPRWVVRVAKHVRRHPEPRESIDGLPHSKTEAQPKE